MAEGTIARLAARRVLEGLRPQQTVTLCLPLFLAGEIGERQFAQEHPTITIDGCAKLCAKRGTEQYSGRVSASLVVSDILGDLAKACHRSSRSADQADEQAIWMVAERIAAEVDSLTSSENMSSAGPSATARDATRCACGSPSPEGKLEVDGKPVFINGLPLIFQHLQKKGLSPESECEEALLATVRIYHEVEASEESAYGKALVAAYRSYCMRLDGPGQ